MGYHGDHVKEIAESHPEWHKACIWGIEIRQEYGRVLKVGLNGKKIPGRPNIPIGGISYSSREVKGCISPEVECRCRILVLRVWYV
jgi:hypothetical protein